MADICQFEDCGMETKPGKTYCSPTCSIKAYHARKKLETPLPDPEPLGLVDRFMSQPEVLVLRAGIQVAVKAALERSL